MNDLHNNKMLLKNKLLLILLLKKHLQNDFLYTIYCLIQIKKYHFFQQAKIQQLHK